MLRHHTLFGMIALLLLASCGVGHSNPDNFEQQDIQTPAEAAACKKQEQALDKILQLGRSCTRDSDCIVASFEVPFCTTVQNKTFDQSNFKVNITKFLKVCPQPQKMGCTDAMPVPQCLRGQCG
jgi:hypothetical protein